MTAGAIGMTAGAVGMTAGTAGTTTGPHRTVRPVATVSGVIGDPASTLGPFDHGCRPMVDDGAGGQA